MSLNNARWLMEVTDSPLHSFKDYGRGWSEKTKSSYLIPLSFTVSLLSLLLDHCDGKLTPFFILWLVVMTQIPLPYFFKPGLFIHYGALLNTNRDFYNCLLCIKNYLPCPWSLLSTCSLTTYTLMTSLDPSEWIGLHTIYLRYLY